MLFTSLAVKCFPIIPSLINEPTNDPAGIRRLFIYSKLRLIRYVRVRHLKPSSGNGSLTWKLFLEDSGTSEILVN
jgi:hypothetical protein